MGRVRRISTYRFVVSLPGGTRAGRKEKLRVGIRRIDFYDAALDIDNGMEWNGIFISFCIHETSLDSP